MRTLLLGDIIAVARALILLPDRQRIGQLGLMIEQAEAAHRFHKRLSKPHPCWGNGSLMARANSEPQVAEPFISDVEYLGVLHMVLGALIAQRAMAQSKHSPIK